MDGFYDGTFLYAEEEILYYLAGKYGMTLLYAPEIGCMHKEAVSTNFVMQDFCDAKIFYFGNITKSYRAFLALMKNMSKHDGLFQNSVYNVIYKLLDALFRWFLQHTLEGY